MSIDLLNEVYVDERAKVNSLRNRINSFVRSGDFPEKLSMPLSVQLELTESCNLRCKHCYNNSGEGWSRTDKVSSNDWIDISKHIVAEGGVFQVVLSGGEPLLLGDKLFDIMDVFHNDGCRFVLITNGYFLCDKKVERLKKYNFAWLQISIDGVEENVHDEFRQKEGSWKKAVEASIRVSSAGIPLKIASSFQPSEINKVDLYIRQAQQLGASAIILGDIIPSGRTFDNAELVLNQEDKSIFFENISKAKSKFGDSISIQANGFVKLQLEQASIGAIDSVIIRPNGEVRLDCVAPFTIGNIFHDSFKDIWSSTPGDLWNHPEIKRYIESVDRFDGSSDYIVNYRDADVELKVF